MPRDEISERQLMALLFTALLSPVMRVLPARPAALAGEAGWFSSLVALPVALALVWVITTLLGPLGPGGGLGEALQRTLGKPLGQLLVALYLLWGLFLLCVNTKLFGLRLLSTGNRNGPLKLYMVVLLAIVLWLARKRLAAFARAGEIFYLALAATLALTLVFGAFHIKVENLFPVWTEDVSRVLRASVPVLGVMGYGVFVAFLGGAVARKKGIRRRCLRWISALCLTLTALQLVCVGNFGPALAARMDTPFFMMVKGIGVDGGFERVESIVIALWVLSDLAFLTLLVFACCTMCQSLLGLKQRRSAALPVVLIALTGGILLFPDAFALENILESVVLLGNLMLGFVVPVAVALVAKLRKQI